MLLVLTGKSGSGKDTAKSLLLEQGYEDVTPTTSRPVRDGEVNGVDYNFITKDEFLKKIANNDFIEYRSYNTLLNGVADVWYYGTEKQTFDRDKNHLLLLDLQGAANLKKIYGSQVVVSYIDVPDDIRKKRASDRGSFGKIEWERRAKDDAIKFSQDNVNLVADFTIHAANLSKEEVANAIKLKSESIMTNKAELSKKTYVNERLGINADSDQLFKYVYDGQIKNRVVLTEIKDILQGEGRVDKAKYVGLTMDAIEEKHWREYTKRPDVSINEMKMALLTGRTPSLDYEEKHNGKIFHTVFSRENDVIRLSVSELGSNERYSKTMNTRDFIDAPYMELENLKNQMYAEKFPGSFDYIEMATISAKDSNFVKINGRLLNGAPDRDNNGVDDRIEDWDNDGWLDKEDNDPYKSRANSSLYNYQNNDYCR